MFFSLHKYIEIHIIQLNIFEKYFNVYIKVAIIISCIALTNFGGCTHIYSDS